MLKLKYTSHCSNSELFLYICNTMNYNNRFILYLCYYNNINTFVINNFVYLYQYYDCNFLKSWQKNDSFRTYQANHG